ncbi:hypothetical protein ABT348_02695 [Streptomyces olivaceus]|uniref:hypothetical protein n=1 Tax=Streptomyces olivaceus TaxID=47716 RepID=UPI0033203D94
MLDQAAQTELAGGGPEPRLLVGEVAGGEAQEVALLGERLQQVGPFTSDGRDGLGVGRLVAGGRASGPLVEVHGLRLPVFSCSVGRDPR